MAVEPRSFGTLGTGEVLSRLAETLTGAGHCVFALDGGGARIGQAEAVLLSFASAAQFENAWHAFRANGPEELARTPFIDLSDPRAVAHAAAEDPSFRFADAALIDHYPEDGRRVLTLLVGGDEATSRVLTDALTGTVRDVFHAGPFGAAHTARSLTAALYMATKTAAGEIAEVAERLGVPAAEILGIINKSSGESVASKVLHRQYTERVGGNADLYPRIEKAMAADVLEAARIAEAAGLSGFFTRRTLDRLEIGARVARGGGV